MAWAPEDFGTSPSIALIVHADAVMLLTVSSIGFAVHIFGARRSSVAAEMRRACDTYSLITRRRSDADIQRLRHVVGRHVQRRQVRSLAARCTNASA